MLRFDEQIATKANLVWSLSGPVSKQLDLLLEEKQIPVLSGYNPTANARAETRHRLGLEEDAILVVGSGPLDIAGGVDFFGAIAAKYHSKTTVTRDVYFAWQGAGPTYPNTPAFYARYAIDVTAGPGKLHILSDIDAERALAAADIFLQTARHEVANATTDAATALGIPSLHMGESSNTDVFSFGSFDLQAAVKQLEHMIEGVQSGSKAPARGSLTLPTRTNLSGFVRSLNSCARHLAVDVRFTETSYSSEHRKALILCDSSLVAGLRESEPVKSYFALPGSIRACRDQLPYLNLPAHFSPHLQEDFADELVFYTPGEAITEALTGHFERIVWFLDTEQLELGEFRRIGSLCHQIAVADDQLINTVEITAPEIAAIMTFSNGELLCSEAS